MNEKILEQLYAPFKLLQRKGLGGKNFDYIPSTDVIDRMNKTFKGMWSTTVLHEEKHEDFVVVRVRVCVYDPETNREFCHDGYGSAQIARYSSGQNKGQSIDMGNPYKAAETKAIRNACTRFGVGLTLENEDYEVNSVPSTPSMPSAPVASAAPTAPSVPTPPKATPSVPVPPAPTATAAAPQATPVQQETPKAKPSPFDNAGKPSPFNKPTTPPPQPQPKAMEVELPTPPAQPEPEVVEAPAPKVEAKKGGPSDVQKAALQGMLVLHGLTLEKLLTKAFENEGIAVDAVPTELDDLDYNQAVVAIKYGSSIQKN